MKITDEQWKEVSEHVDKIGKWVEWAATAPRDEFRSASVKLAIAMGAPRPAWFVDDQKPIGLLTDGETPSAIELSIKARSTSPKGFVCLKTENGQRRAERIEYVQGVIQSGSSVEIFFQTSPEKPTVMVELDMTFDEVMAEIARAQQ